MIDPRLFQSATRSVTVSYPVPFIFVTSLAFTLLCLSGAALTESPLRWIFVGFAGSGAAFGFGLAGFTIIWRGALLRSERHTLAQDYLEFLTAQNMDDSTRESAEKVILGLAGPDTHKPQPRADRGINRNS